MTIQTTRDFEQDPARTSVRDPERDRAYWDKVIAFDDQAHREDLAEHFDPRVIKKGMSIESVFHYSWQALIERYSRGDDIAALGPIVAQCQADLDLRRRTLDAEPNPETRKMWDNLGITDYYTYCAIFAFMVALHWPPGLISRTLSYIKDWQKSAVFMLVYDYANNTLGARHKPTSGLWHEDDVRTYEFLTKVLVAEPEQRAECLVTYMKKWRNKTKALPWSDNLNGAEGAYFGYWAFEAALVAMILDIDDSALQDNRYYPVDLTAFFRIGVAVPPPALDAELEALYERGKQEFPI
jgi:hypothetical protein